MNIEELMNDEAFAAQIQQAATAEEIAALLCGKGIQVTAEAVKAAMAGGAEGELDENALDAVAGGISIKQILKYIKVVGGPILPIRPTFR